MAINDFVLNSEALGGNPPSFEQESQFQTEIFRQVTSRLTHQFKDKENIYKFLEYYLEGFGDVRNEEFKLFSQRNLALAEGVQLDIIGLNLNVDREGREDDDYRREIFLRTLVGASEGTREDIIGLVRLQSNSSKVKYWDLQPAAFQVFSQSGETDLTTAELVRAITPSGVNSQTTIITSNDQIPLVMSESLPLNPTLILDNLDDYITEASELIELTIPAGAVTDIIYGGPLGETDSADDLPYEELGVPVGNIISEAYQI